MKIDFKLGYKTHFKTLVKWNLKNLALKRGHLEPAGMWSVHSLTDLILNRTDFIVAFASTQFSKATALIAFFYKYSPAILRRHKSIYTARRF